jgi:hypothetical protein
MIEPQFYEIAGRRFAMHRMVWGQHAWLMKECKGLNLEDVDIAAVMSMVGDKLTTLMAIALVDEGQEQADKVKAGMAAVQNLREWLDGHMLPEDAEPIVRDFFVYNPVAQQMGRLIEALMSSMLIGSKLPSSS